MSGSHAPHLQRRNGIFHLRIGVPRDLKLRVGMLEVRRSFGTYAPTKARLLAAIYGPRVMEAFEVIRANDFSREDALAVVGRCFSDLTDDRADGFLPCTSEPDQEIGEQRQLALEHIDFLEGCVRDRHYDGVVTNSAICAAAANGVVLADVSAARRADLLEGTARALIEQQRLFLLRLNDRLGPYQPVDPLFMNSVSRAAISATENSSDLPGVTLREVIAAYLRNGGRRWTEKTLAGRVRQMAYVEEYLGADTPITAITSADIRGYRDAVRRLRSNHRHGRGQTFAEKQTENEAHRIQPKTASVIFDTCKAFFRWAKADEGYIATNPAEDVRIDAPKRSKGAKSRRPFGEAELERLFRAPMFTGCKSAHRRFEPGTSIIRDDYYWIAILGFYTGARLGEIVQLHLNDLDLAGAIPFAEITDANSGAIGTEDAKHVKSEAGIRKVPLHPDLFAMGFAEFVAGRRKGNRPSKRLFHRIAYGADRQPSTVYSKWFARFLDKIGLTDTALVFHSFRHAAEDAFRNAGQQQYVIDRIIGHADGATSAAYGEGIDLETAYEAVKAMKLKFRPLHLLKVG